MGLPPQTCFPSSTSTPKYTTETKTQTLACASGYSGAINQQATRTRTDTTTVTVTCADAWATPVSTTTSSTIYSAWSAWSTTSNTCSATCQTRLGTSPWSASPQYQYVSVNAGCPSGYAGSHTYDKQQSQYKTASCANPSAAVDPTWSAYSAWTDTGGKINEVNTCAATCATQLTYAAYQPNPQYQYRTVNRSAACPTGYTGSDTWQQKQVQSRTASCAVPTGTAAPTWSAWSAWTDTGGKINEVNTCTPTTLTVNYVGYFNTAVGSSGNYTGSFTTSKSLSFSTNQPDGFCDYDGLAYGQFKVTLTNPGTGHSVAATATCGSTTNHTYTPCSSTTTVSLDGHTCTVKVSAEVINSAGTCAQSPFSVSSTMSCN